MTLYDQSFATPEENLACDEVLLDQCEEGGGGESLRLWESADYFVAVGYANQLGTEVNMLFCDRIGIRILRRCTGGGTVLQGPGVLNYSLVLRIQESGRCGNIQATNEFILGRHAKALSSLLQAEVVVEGQTDLAISGRKFSGNAQRRRKEFLLFHGTFLLDLDLELVEEALRMPSRQPHYRGKRKHKDFLMNLAAPVAAVKAALNKTWGATEGSQVSAGRVRSLAQEKYASWEWTFRNG